MPYSLYEQGISPGFLRQPYGKAWHIALGAVKDFLVNQTMQGIQQRFPGIAQSEALARLGAERGIPQGANETTPTYVASLLNAWNAWQMAGSPWSILALLNFLGYQTCYLVCANGLTYGPSAGVTLPSATSAGTAPTVTQGSPWTFANGGRSYGQEGEEFPLREWEPSSTYLYQTLVTSNPGNGFAYQVSSAGGTTGTTQPTWPKVIGATVTDGTVTWTCMSAMAQPIGQGQGSVNTAFWSNYMLVFSGLPSTWSNVVNPPTPTSSPSLYEIDTIEILLTLFGPGFATCAGIMVVEFPGTLPMSFGWPSGRTIEGNAGTVGQAARWAPHTAFALSAYAVPTNIAGHYYQATTAGTSGWLEPTWPTTTGATVTDGTVTWTCVGPTNNYLSGSPFYGTVFAFVPQDPYN